MLKRGFNGTFTCVNAFRSLTLYSTSVPSKDGITNPRIVEFLVKSVGFSKEEAVPIVTKVSHLSKSTAKQPELAVGFLQSSGFDEAHIRRLLTSLPKLLRCNVEKTLKPKIRAFQNLGFCSSNLGIFVSQYPFVLNRSIKRFIVPSFEMLKSLFDSNEELLSFLLKPSSQRLLSSIILKYLPDNVRLLQNYGVPREKINKLLLRRPRLFMQKTQWFEKKLKSVEQKLGIPRTSVQFVHGFSALSMISENRLESWLQVLRNHGWSETEISTLLRTHPTTSNLSAKLLSVKLKYFMEDRGYGSDYLAAHPVLLSLSLEKRILPRAALIQALKEKQLLKRNEGFYNLMCKAESKFLELCVIPFKDKLPQQCEDYMQQTSRRQVALSL